MVIPRPLSDMTGPVLGRLATGGPTRWGPGLAPTRALDGLAHRAARPDALPARRTT
ncbi:hypothetical protein ACGF4C_15035 [Streptomyces sp. NPDC048197]|uniref:hypothetical protein n=1 Tax=Streptomyces sp. NPDC048197 TaxID=3365511 RepID=UPI0037151109